MGAIVETQVSKKVISHSEYLVSRGIVCEENFFVKSDLRLKPLSEERAFS